MSLEVKFDVSRMAEKIYNATDGSGNEQPERISDEVLREIIGIRNVGFDTYQVVYPQEYLWVLDMRFVSNDSDSLRRLRESVRVLGKAYSRHGRGGRYLRITAWGGIEEFIH